MRPRGAGSIGRPRRHPYREREGSGRAVAILSAAGSCGEKRTASCVASPMLRGHITIARSGRVTGPPTKEQFFMTGAEFLLRCLRDQGLGHVFLVPGGHIDPLV